MKLWKVTADKTDYDQYGAFVVWATSDKNAVALVLEEASSSLGLRPQIWTAHEINVPELSQIVLGSFNAG